MPKKQVKIAYITDESSRRTSYNKRKAGLVKKVKELSILCGIDACIIIYGENSSQPEVWPPGQGTSNVLSRYLSYPEDRRINKMVDLEGQLKKSIKKSEEQLRKQRVKNKKNETALLFSRAIMNPQEYDFSNASINELNDLAAFIDDKLKEVEQKLKSMETQEVAENGIEAMKELDPQGNMGNAQGLVISGGDMHADVQGFENNMSYDMLSDEQKLIMDFSIKPFDDVNMDTSGLWSI